MATVRLENVSKNFGAGTTALDRVNLEIADGELMVVVGPSGCGKTTMLRLIAGLERPSQGCIRIGDRIINDVPPQDRQVAMVFQNYALYPHLSVRQNLAFALRFRRCPRVEIEARVREVAAVLGLEDLLERKPAALSGGQRQRVALGRAMAQRPSVFLFDEPLSNLDPQSRLLARRELRLLHRRLKTTTVYVTHDQAEAMTLGDRIAVVCEGALRQVGQPREVYEAPADRFVAGFIGTPPMNFFEGTLQADERGAVFSTPDGEIALPEEWGNCGRAVNGRRVVLGVRPRDLRRQALGNAEENALSGTVDAVETPGDRLDAHVRTSSGAEFVMSLDPGSPLRVGDVVRATPDPSGIRMFEDGPFGRSIAPGGPA